MKQPQIKEFVLARAMAQEITESNHILSSKQLWAQAGVPAPQKTVCVGGGGEAQPGHHFRTGRSCEESAQQGNQGRNPGMLLFGEQRESGTLLDQPLPLDAVKSV